jgi:energy-coupling factor transporter transmembrane protein EcfT
MTLLAAFLATALLLVLRPGAAGGLAGLALALALRRGGGWSLLRLAATIAGITLVLNAFTEPGPALCRWGPIAVTRTGLVAGAERAARLVGLVAVGWLATRDLGLERLADLAARATWPLERWWPRLAGLGLALGLAVRFLPEIQHEIARLKLAAAARPSPAAARRPRWGQGRIAGLEPLFLPLLAGTVRRAEEVARTLDARGYGSGPRTRVHGERLGGRELGLGLAMVIGALLVLLADVLAGG